jgi:hypothetical protein
LRRRTCGPGLGARVGVLVLVDLALFLLDLGSQPLGRLVDELGATRARAIDDLDAVLAERRQPAVDLIGRHHVLGHVVVDLVVGDEALLLAELDQLVARGVAVATGAAAAARAGGAHRLLAGLGLDRRAPPWLARRPLVLVVVGDVARHPRRRVARVRSGRRKAALPGLSLGIGTKSSS